MFLSARESSWRYFQIFGFLKSRLYVNIHGILFPISWIISHIQEIHNHLSKTRRYWRKIRVPHRISGVWRTNLGGYPGTSNSYNGASCILVQNVIGPTSFSNHCFLCQFHEDIDSFLQVLSGCLVLNLLARSTVWEEASLRLQVLRYLQKPKSRGKLMPMRPPLSNNQDESVFLPFIP